MTPPSSTRTTIEGGELRPTHAEKDSKGEWLGFEGRLAVYPATALFAGILVFSILYSFKHAPLVPTFVICMAPGALVTLVVLKLVNKKPPGYLGDWITTKCGRASIEHRPSRLRHPLAQPDEPTAAPR